MAAKPLDPSFFRPFVEGTLNTLKVSCAVEATPDKPFIKGMRDQPEFEIAGVIGLTSASFTGSITLCFPSGLYLALMSNMLGEKFTEITKDLQDGAAELLNMIFGHAKVVLNKEGHAIEKAIPAVIYGKGLRSSHPGQAKVIVLPFKTAHGELHIEICAEVA